MALYRLGNLYLNNGKLDEAKKMYQWALQGLEKAGSDHKSIPDTVNGLGQCAPGQAGRGREDVPAGNARIREGMGPRLQIKSGEPEVYIT